MTNKGDDLDIRRIEEVMLQKEEDLKGWCPSSGENVDSMIEFPGTDDWHIECPSCGTRWAGGSTVLSDHNKPDFR